MVFFLVLYELTVQKIKPATANISITGSASMKTGRFPYVSETIVDDRRIRQIPDARTASPFLRTGFIRAIT